MTEILRKTQSVCPVCLKRLDAAYVQCAEGVWLEKTCPQHGDFAAQIWDSAEGFRAWLRESPAQAPHNPQAKHDKGCPYDCGLCPQHQQASCCVLLEVTGRCNLRCPICYAAAEEYCAKADPTLETIEGWYDMLLRCGGPFNIQLSGGEPTLRDDLPAIIRAGKERGFTFFQLNTNGLRLAEDKAYLAALVAAGLNTVFLQFDSLDGEANIRLRGRNLVEIKQKAVQNCSEAGVGVVLVPTVMAGCNLDGLGEILEYAAANMPTVRGVHFQPVSFFGRYNGNEKEQRVTVPKLLQALEKQTAGRVKAKDFAPGSAEHALCTFHADFTVIDGKWKLEKSGSSCCCGPKNDDLPRAVVRRRSRSGEALPRAVVRRSSSKPSSDLARDAVAQKWRAPTLTGTAWKGDSRYELSSLDEFLVRRQTQTLALSGMAFQDAWTVDLQRLCRCHVHVVTPEGTLAPFCAYNLTNTAGEPLHRS